MATERESQRVDDYIRKGIAEGARLIYGGPGPVASLQGAYVLPMIFADVAPDSTIAQEEIFGPVLTVIPYADEDEAVEIANSTIYGLGGAVFGDEERALSVARRIRAGQIDINGFKFNMIAPFGGHKHSCHGRRMGSYGLAECVEIKAIQR